MKALIAFLAFVLLGQNGSLKETALSCGGDILIVIEDVHFRQQEVEPDETVCIENQSDEPALVTDGDDDEQIQFVVPARGYKFLDAQPTYVDRVITIDEVP